MRTVWPTLLYLTATTVVCTDTASFERACPNSRPLNLFKRATCPSGYSSCSGISASNECCPSNTSCGRDANNNVACCPIGKTCTGVVGAVSTGSTTSSGFVLGGSTTSTQQVTASGYSTIPNQYYPFVAIPTSYVNQAACLQAYTTCQSASTACFNSLATNNGIGLTVSGINSVITTQLAPTGTLAVASASSICSSLSQSGCYGIQSTLCAAFGTAGQTATFVQPAGAARCTGAVYMAAAAGLGVGIAVL